MCHFFKQPFKLDSKHLVFADCIRNHQYTPVSFASFSAGLYLFNIHTGNITEWIQYPTDFRPEQALLTIDKKNGVVYIWEKDVWNNNLTKLYQVNIQKKRWKYLGDISTQNIAITSINPFVISSKNNNKEENHFKMIGVEQEGFYETKHFCNCYNLTKHQDDCLHLVHVNKSKNYIVSNKHPIIIPNINKLQTFIMNKQCIKQIDSVTGNVTNIYQSVPNAFDYKNGAHMIRGNKLLIFNQIFETGDRFISIIDDFTRAPIAIRKSMLKAPIAEDLYTIIAEDEEEEKLTVHGYINTNIANKYSLIVPTYIMQIVNQYYSNEICFMFAKENMYMRSILFIRVKVDAIVNDTQAIKKNEEWAHETVSESTSKLNVWCAVY